MRHFVAYINQLRRLIAAVQNLWWLQALLASVLGIAILIGRLPQAFRRPQFWAEDGTIYFLQAWQMGVRSLITPYNGCPYLFQRLVAYIGNWVPVAYLPHFYGGAALFVTLAVMVYVIQSRTPLSYRFLCALAVVAIPQSFEVLMNLTNVHWILALGLVILAIADEPIRQRGAILELIFAGIASFSGAFAFLFLPMFVARAAIRRSAHSVRLTAVLVAACMLQWSSLQTNRTSGAFHWLDRGWLGLIGNGISGRFLVSYAFHAKHPYSVGLTIVTTAIYGVLFLWAVRTRNTTVLTLLGAAVFVMAASAFAYRNNPAAMHPPNGERYTYIPSVCIIWAILYVMHRPAWTNRSLGLLLIPMLAALVLSFRANPWHVEDYHWKEASIGLRGPHPCQVHIPPDWTIKYVPVQ